MSAKINNIHLTGLTQTQLRFFFLDKVNCVVAVEADGKLWTELIQFHRDSAGQTPQVAGSWSAVNRLMVRGEVCMHTVGHVIKWFMLRFDFALPVIHLSEQHEPCVFGA